MKTLKLDHAHAKQVIAGAKRSTWRINDEKGITVNDQIELIDKVDPNRPDSWRAIGEALVDAVIEKRLGEITAADLDENHEFESHDEMLHHYQRYYGNEVSDSTVVKMIHFSFTPYDVPKEAAPTGNFEHVKLFTDGGSRGNPGPSALGFAILDMDNNVVGQGGMYLGITTNNQAEYQGLKLGLEEAQRMGVKEVDVHMDSLLVINQMKGIYKIKNRDLWPIHQSITENLSKFKRVTFTHVPRELNKIADTIVNKTLDAERER